MRSAPLLLALAILVTARVAHAQPWCRIDDPAAFTAARASLPVDRQGEVGAVSCPPIAAPQMLPEELALPMPCGRYMVFRRVTVTMEHALDHQTAYFGEAVDADSGIRLGSESPWTGYIAGNFRLPGNGSQRRAFYIGKYPVTAPQYRLWDQVGGGLLAPTGKAADERGCAENQATLKDLRERSILPATGVSWFDAVNFARAYTEWLMAIDKTRRNAGQPPFLPWERGSSGFLRLPTEAEWEFAARGGQASLERQTQAVYPVTDANGQMRDPGLSEIAQLESQNGRPLGVGAKLPNTLGLYDMIGNQGQIVFDLFHPTRPGMLQGATGGFVVRGGSVRGSTGVGDREERELFVDGHLNRDDPTLGFRLIVSAPLVVSDGDWHSQRATPTVVAAEWKEAREHLMSPGRLPDMVPREQFAQQLNALDKANAEAASARRRAEEEARKASDLEQLVARIKSEQEHDAAASSASLAHAQAEIEGRKSEQVHLAERLTKMDADMRIQAQQASNVNQSRIQALEAEAERIKAERSRQADQVARAIAEAQAERAHADQLDRNLRQQTVAAAGEASARVQALRDTLNQSTAALNQSQSELAAELTLTAVALARTTDGLGRANMTSAKFWLPMIPALRSSTDQHFQSSAVRADLAQIAAFLGNNIPYIETVIGGTFDRYVETVLHLSRMPPQTIEAALTRTDERLQSPTHVSSELFLVVQRQVHELLGANGVLSPAMRGRWLNELDPTRSLRVK